MNEGMACSHETSLHRICHCNLGLGGPVTVDRVRYCARCGLMEVTGTNRGKEIGHFIDLVTRFSRYIEGMPRSRIRPLTQVERRLIIRKMQEDELFNDHYGSYYSIQLYHFVKLLREHRAQFRPETILDILPA